MDLHANGKNQMEIGMIGLGRMGAAMALRLARGGHVVRAFDPDAAALGRAAAQGIFAHPTIEALLEHLAAPRVLWLMVPSGAATESAVQLLAPLLDPGDRLIDGGNSYYRDSMRRGAELAQRKIAFVDCGTSGGIWGLEQGYSMMIGGDDAVVKSLVPIFETLAPGRAQGWGRVGPCGAGHYTKMIHNGIEYGMMQSYAEGFSLLEHKAEFGLELGPIAEIWRYGSVVRSWLLDLTAAALARDPKLAGVAPYVEDSGEGRWTVAEAVSLGIPAPVITLSLYERLRSRDAASFTDKLLAAMRREFGGHAVRKA